jgi:hypothetical protein
MLASTPANRPIKDRQTVSEQLVRMSPRDWLLSIGMHLGIFSILIWLLPVHELLEVAAGDAQKKNTPADQQKAAAADTAEEELKKDPERVKEVVDQIETIQSDSAQATVEDLLNSEKDMDSLAQDSVDQLNREAQQIAPTAAENALAELQNVSANQNAILQDQAKLNDANAALLARANDAQQANGDDGKLKAALDAVAPLQNQINQLQEDIRKNQVAAEEAQNKATQMLTFGGETYKPRLDEQTAADTAQTTASDSEGKQADLQGKMLNALNDWAYQAGQVRQLNEHVAQLQTDIGNLTNQIPQLEQTWKDAAKAAQDADQAAWSAGFKADQSKNDGDRQAANAAKDADKQAHAAADNAGAVLSKARMDLSGKQWSFNFESGLSKKASAAVAADQPLVSSLAPQFAGQEKQGSDQETAAGQAQQDALAKLADAVQKAKVAGNKPSTGAHFSAPILSQAEPSVESLKNKNLADLYREALEAEARITEKYRVFRAAQLATIRKTSLDDALAQTQVAKPDHEKLNADLLAAKGAEADLSAYKSEVLKANQQLGDMATLSGNMVAQAESEKDLAAETLGAGGAGGGDDAFQMMADMATANDDSPGKDLTGFMQGQGAGEGGGGSGTSGGGHTPGDYGRAKPLPSDRARYAVPGYGRNAPELPNMDYDHIKPYATRRITDDGPYHADWLYVDSWYLIGPFPNPGRRNLNTKFPPESIVDLNAVYPGKNNVPVRWVFTQWNDPALSPAHCVEDAPAIYYAYTELYFDHPADLWITSGSDDKGTMWINNVMVWKSGDQLKSWIPNEGYRKVHFARGYNRVLYRLENAQSGAAFSLMLSTKR